MLIAISRVQDYRHSAFDVTWGSIIGIVFAMFAYLQYYPSLTSKTSQIPHPPRDFSYLIRDYQGRTEEAGHLESAIGIQPNSAYVDESGQQQQRQQYHNPVGSSTMEGNDEGYNADYYATNKNNTTTPSIA